MIRTKAATDGIREAVTHGNAHSKVTLANVAFDNVSMAEAVQCIDALIRRGEPAMVITPNVDHLIRLQSDVEYQRIVARADLLLADGQPLVWTSRLLGKPLKERVAGSDVVPEYCKHAARVGQRVFLLGGAPGTAERAKEILEERNPGLHVVGTYCPPLGFEQDPAENRKTIEAVKSAQPDIVFVALGSPKQEKWIAAHMHEYGARVSIGIGIAFSYLAGDVKRAPVYMRRVGMEWLYRLYREPGRLWHRYLIRGVRFGPIVLREIVGKRRRPQAGPTENDEIKSDLFHETVSAGWSSGSDRGDQAQY